MSEIFFYIEEELSKAKKYSKDELLYSIDLFFPLDAFSLIEAEQYKTALMERSNELGIKPEFEKILKAAEKEIKENEKQWANTVDACLVPLPYKTKSGKPLAVWQNTETLLKEYNITCKYNELTKDVEWNSKEYSQLSEDAIIADLQSKFLQKGYKAGNDNTVRSHISIIAQNNRFHPIRDYLLEVKDTWDGTDYIKQLFDCFVIIDEQKPFYSFLLNLFEKWFIAAVKLIFNDGSASSQGVLILIGGQGIGKSRWKDKILPVPSWGKEGMNITSDKDSIIQALSYWIVELGEYCTNKNKLEDYKRFVTNSTDTFRKPYSREYQVQPRMTVFYATTNEDEFLIDNTGERRNWPIGLKAIKENNIDKNGLWSQAAHLALNENLPHWLNKEEIDQLNRMNTIFKDMTDYEELLLREFDWDTPESAWIYLIASDICELLGLDRRTQNRIVGKSLRTLERMGIKFMGRKGKFRYKIYKVPLFNEDGNGNYRNQTAKKKSEEYERFFK